MADDGLFIGVGGSTRQILNLKRANRHGLIAGATGTGKTVTLQGIVEGFSAIGVPSFVADVKGDLSGMAMAGSSQTKTHEIFAARAKEIGQDDWTYRDNPVQFWDLFGEQGHPIRTTVSEMGPLLLARLMDLNEVQEGVLTIAFHVADKDGLLLLDLDDLQAMLVNCAGRADELTTTYGNISKQSVGTIQRSLLQLRSQGGGHFFGEPALDLDDFMVCDDGGRGIINILAADKLMQSPKLYSTFLLWMLSELFETLPEIGDPEKPKMCFFFDEAHLLFNDAPKALLEKIEQVVRLIRSKGVGVYFITQNPVDIPNTVAAQLSNRVQHALRAFTPRDQQAVKSAAQTFRANPGVNVETAITELRVGEALVSLLQADGSPTPVERTLIKAPASRVGPVTAQERAVMISSNFEMEEKYRTTENRESAHEILNVRTEAMIAEAEIEKNRSAQEKMDALKAKAMAKAELAAARAKDRAEDEALELEFRKVRAAERQQERAQVAAEREAARQAREDAKPGLAEKMVTRAATSAASSVGRALVGGRGGGIAGQLVRGLLGGLFRGR